MHVSCADGSDALPHGWLAHHEGEPTWDTINGRRCSAIEARMKRAPVRQGRYELAACKIFGEPRAVLPTRRVVVVLVERAVQAAVRLRRTTLWRCSS